MSASVNIFVSFLLKEVDEQGVAPEATDDGYAFQVSESQSTFNF